MSIISQYPRKDFIPIKTITLADNSFEEVKVLDHLNASYNTAFNKNLIFNEFVVDASTEGRLDLIAWNSFGSTDLWWFIGYMNGVVNPIFDLPVGKVLKIPRQEDLEFLLKTTNKQVQARTTIEIP